ncbi:MAG: hypothetical protein L0220_17480 [Acidobacteria bacterium]|nr:hypothetical protein [Acidobacteriota bacterium]
MPRPKGSSSRAELVRLAIAGLDAQIQELTEKRKQLVKMAPGVVSAAPAGGGPVARRSMVVVAASKAAPAKKKRVVSAATRRKLKEAAKARWARIRATKG